jgi:hypothetical protein
MPVIVASREEVQKYFDTDCLSQSKLKGLTGDLSQFNKEVDSSAEHFVIGSAVDLLLTGVEGDFKKEYYISNVDKLPSEAVVSILKRVHEDLLTDYAESLEVIVDENLPQTSFADFVGDLETHRAYILDACAMEEWQPRWGDDAKVSNIVKSGEDYFKDLAKSFGKRVISLTQYETIKSIVTSLRTNPRTERYFNRVSFEQNSNVTAYYQLPIYFTIQGIKCKALLDLVIVEKDDDGNIVSVEPIDLKTMNGNTYNFPFSLRQRRYDIQAVWYTKALKSYFKLSESSPIVHPFKFVVESTSYQGKPLVFEMQESLYYIGLEGREEIKSDVNIFAGYYPSTILPEIKGVKQLLNLYIYHTENGFNLEKKIQDAGLDPLKLQWDGII